MTKQDSPTKSPQPVTGMHDPAVQEETQRAIDSSRALQASLQPLSVHAALIEVRRKVGAVRKDSRSEQPGARFNFRGIDAVVNASAGPLIEYGVSIVPECVVSCEQVDVKSGSKRTDMQATRLTIRFRVYGPRGDSFPIEAAGEAFDSGDKSTPKASSIAWRTALLQVLHIPTDEPDPDSFHYDRNDPASHVPEPQPEPTPLQLARRRAWHATNGAGDDDERAAILRSRMQRLELAPDTQNPDDWTAAAVDLELNGFDVPGAEPQVPPEPQSLGPAHYDPQAASRGEQAWTHPQAQWPGWPGFPVSEPAPTGEQF